VNPVTANSECSGLVLNAAAHASIEALWEFCLHPSPTHYFAILMQI